MKKREMVIEVFKELWKNGEFMKAHDYLLESGLSFEDGETALKEIKSEK